ncbi:dihydrodipicolinate synthase family protein, partial [Streptomyces olivaceus]
PTNNPAPPTRYPTAKEHPPPPVTIKTTPPRPSGDYPAAMKVWEQIRRFEELRAAGGSANNVTVVKEALASLGLCRREVRPPSKPLPESERAEVAAIAAGWSI